MPRVTSISRMTIKPGREADYVRLCTQLADKVRATEQDVLLYEFFRLRDPRCYALIESYPDMDAEHTHMNGAALAELGPQIIDCLDGGYEREYLYPLERT